MVGTMKTPRPLTIAALLLATGQWLFAGSDSAAKGEVLRSLSFPRDQAAAEHGAAVGGSGYRTVARNGDVSVPVVVVGGTPYEMGWHLGHLLKPEINQFVPSVVAGMKTALKMSDAQLDATWASMAAFTDDRVERELLGVADGAGIPRRTLQQAHCIPLLMPYSCSSVAAWGKATADGHLYQTRDLDWNLEIKAHEFPAVVVYLPSEGHPHVLPTFAGFSGANCGLSAAGIALSEMGDSPAREMPYPIDAPHFTSLFRTMLYDAQDLSEALAIFRQNPLSKRYHFVFGDGRQEKRAVKIRAHMPEPVGEQVKIWTDNDSTDELAPAVLPCVVYQDEGRGAFPIVKKEYGKLDGPRMIDLATRIPICGDNVMDVVFDATALRLWVSYAHGDREAYQRPFVEVDLRALDGDGDFERRQKAEGRR